MMLLATAEEQNSCGGHSGVVEDVTDMTQMTLLQLDMVVPHEVDPVSSGLASHKWVALVAQRFLHLTRAAIHEVTMERVRGVLLFCMFLVTMQLFTVMWHVSRAKNRPHRQRGPRTHTYQRGISSQPKSAFSG